MHEEQADCAWFECQYCEGTGLFPSQSLPKGVGKICWDCYGSGKTMEFISYMLERGKDAKRFRRRKRRRGITVVVGITALRIMWWKSTYEKFLQIAYPPMPPSTEDQRAVMKQFATKVDR